MQKEQILYAVIGLLVGSLLTIMIASNAVNTGNTSMMQMMGDETDISKLEQSENFDKAFIEEMIPHHQMAVMMATMLKNSTQRPEMKKLADNIISTQTKEINEMRQWYQSWGY